MRTLVPSCAFPQLTYNGSFVRHICPIDGPYGGNACGATDHDHYGADDSVQQQWQNQVGFYEEVGSE